MDIFIGVFGVDREGEGIFFVLLEFGECCCRFGEFMVLH
jgi:hypothetical protein